MLTCRNAAQGLERLIVRQMGFTVRWDDDRNISRRPGKKIRDGLDTLLEAATTMTSYP
jgi:hypothetical protein